MEKLFKKYHIDGDIVAIGVSGGADSMALALMAAEQLAPLNKKIVALTVDHGLRPSSADEAQYVAQVMAQFGIEHHILPWIGEKPTTGIEEAARQVRYRLIRDWCFDHDINCVMMAHHLQDQAETFLIRLQRGSGLTGLCAMREFEDMDGFLILRPFLDKNPEELKAYLQQKGVRWVEDESNEDEQYLRNKIRKFLPILEKQIGISAEDICQTVSRLQSSEDYIEKDLEKFFNKEVFFEIGDVYYCNYKAFCELHHEMQFRVLAQILCDMYIPRAEKILNLQRMLQMPDFKGTTLGKKEIFIYDKKIWFVPELSFKRKAYRKDWAEFVVRMPKYKNKKLPAKVKYVITRAVME